MGPELATSCLESTKLGLESAKHRPIVVKSGPRSSKVGPTETAKDDLETVNIGQDWKVGNNDEWGRQVGQKRRPS